MRGAELVSQPQQLESKLLVRDQITHILVNRMVNIMVFLQNQAFNCRSCMIVNQTSVFCVQYLVKVAVLARGGLSLLSPSARRARAR